jgi:phosphate starvation-inducible PhoH-like protein
MSKKRTRREIENSPQKVKAVEAKTNNQKEYIRSIIDNDVIFCTGPSGCGKSFIASGIAAEHLHRGDIEQVIVTRPLVCTGKEIAPYLLPMQENFKFFLGRAYYGHYYNEGKIRYAPLEVMRGSTFHNSYMILDEAQNCTWEQIKMFITRMGQGSKVIINGDIRQTDLSRQSGLEQIIEKLGEIDGVGLCRLGYSDIQRNGILGEWSLVASTALWREVIQ